MATKKDRPSEGDTVSEPIELVSIPGPKLDELLVQLDDVVRNIQGDVRSVAVRVRARLAELRRGEG